MADSVKISSILDGVEKTLNNMIKQANLVPGYLNRVVYAQYKKAQRERWKTENTGDSFVGGAWAPLNPKYEYRKHYDYQDYPGAGTKKLIATNRLFNSMIEGNDHRKIVTDRSLYIYTTVPYATHVDEIRTISQYSVKFKSEVFKGLKDYLIKGTAKNVGGIF